MPTGQSSVYRLLVQDEKSQEQSHVDPIFAFYLVVMNEIPTLIH